MVYVEGGRTVEVDDHGAHPMSLAPKSISDLRDIARIVPGLVDPAELAAVEALETQQPAVSVSPEAYVGSLALSRSF